MMKRIAALKRVSILGLTLVVIGAGAFGLYQYTNPPTTVKGAIGASVVVNQGSPGYLTVQFNGSTWQASAKGPNAPSFSCPVGTDSSLCKLLEQTCGNGVGPAQEPWKNCMNCPFDAGCTGQQSCDPYTHECSVLVGACQVAVYGGQ